MKVEIFTTNTCAYCRMVKQFLTRKGVKYEEVNLDSNPDRQHDAYTLSGALTVPITVVTTTTGDMKVIVGWNPSKLTEAIA